MYVPAVRLLNKHGGIKASRDVQHSLRTPSPSIAIPIGIKLNTVGSFPETHYLRLRRQARKTHISTR